MGALSRAVALRFEPQTTLKAGSELVLGINPRATATTRTVQGSGTTEAQALARGLGAGISRYYTDVGLEPVNGYIGGLSDSSDFYESIDLTILSGGGEITGAAEAQSLATGPADLLSVAQATNIGLANLDFTSRYGGVLKIGLEDSPFSAEATATADRQGFNSLQGNTPPVAELEALAIVRGIEGSLQDRPAYDSSPEDDFSKDFLGQPKANVQAQANLDLCTDDLNLTASGVADAVGLERISVKNVPLGDRNGAASISGEARSNVTTKVGLNPQLAEVEQIDVTSKAIGIDKSRLFGAPTLNTQVGGYGLASLEFENGDCFEMNANEADVSLLQGIGINCTEIFTNRGNDVIEAAGGAVLGGASLSIANQTHIDSNFNHKTDFDSQTDFTRNTLMDAAGFTGSDIYTGMGDDSVRGVVYTEADVNLDANGDGVFSSNVFLDESAVSPYFPGGFAGIRDTIVDTGMGNDSIQGSSQDSWLFGSMGNDNINLDRAWDTQLWGGLDNDMLSINGPILGYIEQWGGLGDDVLTAADGANGSTIKQVLDGGLGQDALIGGDGQDDFLFTSAAGALLATSNSETNGKLTDPEYWDSLNDYGKQLIWDNGLVSDGQSIIYGQSDTIKDFEAGENGDVMYLNSSLSGITSEMWDQYGQIFSVNDQGQLEMEMDHGSEMEMEEGADNALCHPNIGVIVGELSDIQKLGMCSPQIAYSTDTKQLMFDADGDWSSNSVTFGTVNMNGELDKTNFSFSNQVIESINPTAGSCAKGESNALPVDPNLTGPSNPSESVGDIGGVPVNGQTSVAALAHQPEFSDVMNLMGSSTQQPQDAASTLVQNSSTSVNSGDLPAGSTSLSDSSLPALEQTVIA